jgi:CRISPR/Cas system-associated exonuclease Cas4 (RecB family)
VDQGGEASAHGERIHKALEDRIKEGTTLPSELNNLEPTVQVLEQYGKSGSITAEQELTLNAKLEPTGWWSKDAWMRSKLDVLVTVGDKAVVVDWKTGKRRPDFAQLDLFALQVFLQFPEIKWVSSTFVWTKDLNTDGEVYTRDKKGELLTKLLEKTKRIEAALEKDKWPAKPSGLCNFCPCKDFCEYT